MLTFQEKLLKDSEEVYDKFVEKFEQKEEEQDKILQALEADIESQKQEEENFLKRKGNCGMSLVMVIRY